MTILQLKYFVAISRYSSFSGAAKHLYISQTAISHSIAGLESELGFKLFYRDTHTVKLTEAGTAFLPVVTEILEKLDAAVQTARNANSGKTGSIKIGFLSSIMKAHFSDWIPPFKEKYPNVSIDIEQLYALDLRNSLESNITDVAITRSYDLEDTNNISWVKLFDDHTALVVHQNNPLSAANSDQEIDFSRLAQERFIIITANTSPYWHRKMRKICENRGFSPQFAFEPVSMETVYTLLGANLGVAILPESGKVYNTPNLKFIRLHGDDAQIEVCAAWNNSNTNPLIPAFIKSLLDSIAGQS